MPDGEDNPDVNDLLDALKVKSDIRDVNRDSNKEKFSLSKDNLEEFILNNAGKLINDSMGYIEDIGQYVSAAPDSRDVEALAKLVSSSAAALDSLQKIHIADERNKTAFGIKTLDIESKKALQSNDHENKLLLNREELMANLLKDANVIDVNDVEEESGNP